MNGRPRGAFTHVTSERKTLQPGCDGYDAVRWLTHLAEWMVHVVTHLLADVLDGRARGKRWGVAMSLDNNPLAGSRPRKLEQRVGIGIVPHKASEDPHFLLCKRRFLSRRIHRVKVDHARCSGLAHACQHLARVANYKGQPIKYCPHVCVAPGGGALKPITDQRPEHRRPLHCDYTASQAGQQKRITPKASGRVDDRAGPAAKGHRKGQGLAAITTRTPTVRHRSTDEINVHRTGTMPPRLVQLEAMLTIHEHQIVSIAPRIARDNQRQGKLLRKRLGTGTDLLMVDTRSDPHTGRMNPLFLAHTYPRALPRSLRQRRPKHTLSAWKAGPTDIAGQAPSAPSTLIRRKKAEG